MPESSGSLRQRIETRYDARAKTITLDATSFGDQIADLLDLINQETITLADAELTPPAGTRPVSDIWSVAGKATIWSVTDCPFVLNIRPGNNDVALVTATATTAFITMKALGETVLPLDPQTTDGLGSIVLTGGAITAIQPDGILSFFATMADGWSPFGLEQIHLEKIDFRCAVVSDVAWGRSEKVILTADLAITSDGKQKTTIPLEVDVPLGGGAWSAGIVAPGVTLNGLSAIACLLGGDDYVNVIPDRVRDIAELQLETLVVLFDPAGPSWNGIDIGISTAHPWPIADKIAVEKVGLHLSVRPGTTPKVTGQVTGRFKVDVLEFGVAIPIPLSGAITISGSSTQPLPGFGTLASLVDAPFATSLPDGVANLGALNINSLHLNYDIDAKMISGVGFQVASENTWTLIPKYLSLENLIFGIDARRLSNSWNITGGASGTVIVADIPVSVSVEGGAGTWVIKITRPVNLPSIKELAQMFGGDDAASALPAGFGDGVGALTIWEYEMDFGGTGNSLQRLTLNFGTSEAWKFWDPYFVLESLLVALKVDGPVGTRTLDANIDGVLKITPDVSLVLSAVKPASGSGWTFSGEFVPDQELAIGDFIADLLAKFKLTAPGVPSALKMDVLSFEAQPSSSYYSFVIDVEGDWEIVKKLKVEEIGAAIKYDNGAVDATFKGDFVVGGVDVAIRAEYDSEAGGWRFSGTAGRGAPIKVGDFVARVASDFSATVADALPDPLRTLEISHLYVSFDTATKNFVFECEIKFTIEGTDLDLQLRVDLKRDGDNYTQTYGGTLTIGSLHFGLLFEKAQQGGAGRGSSTKFLATAKSDGKVGLRSLLGAISQDAASLMPDLELALEDALFVYEKKNGADPIYLFGLAVGLDLNLNLSHLPVVGPVFNDSKLGGIKDVQALYASVPVVADDVNAINGLLGQMKVQPALPIKQGTTGTAPVLTKGFNFAADIDLGGSPVPMTAGGATAPSATVPAPPTPAPSPPSGNASWIAVKKSIGPVTLERVGVRYENGRVWLLLDGDFVLAGLSLGLQGLGLGFELGDLKHIAANLDGLSLSFKSGSLEIAGGFVRFGNDYIGEARVKAGAFGLTAIGGYAPSEKAFFIFVRLNAPIGGPPFFFVTGVAGGFGVNRALTLPPIDELSKFPLLPANSTFPARLDAKDPGTTLATTLASTQKALRPLAGSNWVAAGLDFTSFEMIDSSALVTVAFGVDFEIALLGITRVTVPKLAPEPIVYLEIALEARFKPSEGLIAVDGRLTPASFLYAGLCKITGGFAFYTWFAGPHEGDFVVSIGGYHPRFHKPDNYPVVPRLQMTYQVGALVIKGQAYFALTPHLLMAGIQIDATWSSGPVQAWFSAGMDFLLGWSPFHYEADAYVHIGVSVNIDLLFTSVTITIHVGVDLNIWGPPFGGKATIDLDIVSFTVTFGDDPRTETVDWTGFKKSFLPAGAHAPAAPRATAFAAAARAAVDDADGLLCTASVTDGLVQDVKAKEPAAFFSWIVDSNHFVVESNTLIPSKQATYNAFNLQTPFTGAQGLKYNGAGKPPQAPTPLVDGNKYPGGMSWTDQFGVLPMKLGTAGFQTHHTVRLRKLREGADYTVAANYDDVDEIAVQPVLKSSSSALWAPSDPGLNGSRLVENTLVGVRLSPMIQYPDVTFEADLWAMLFDQTQTVEWTASTPAVDRGDTFGATIENNGTRLTFQFHGDSIHCDSFKLTALTDSTSGSAREDVVGGLNGLGFAFVVDAIDVKNLAQYPLWDWPMIRTLGEERAAA